MATTNSNPTTTDQARNAYRVALEAAATGDQQAAKDARHDAWEAAKATGIQDENLGRDLCLAIGEALNDVRFISAALQQRARHLAGDMAHLADRAIPEGQSVNSLGEVQGAGSEIDRLCGERKRAIEAAERLIWTAFPSV